MKGMSRKGDMKTLAIQILVIAGILFLLIILYRVVFKGGLLKV